MSSSSLESPSPPRVSSYASVPIQLQSNLSERATSHQESLRDKDPHSSLYTAEQKDTGTSYEAQGFLCGEEMNAWFNKQKLAAVSTGEEAAGSGFL